MAENERICLPRRFRSRAWIAELYARQYYVQSNSIFRITNLPEGIDEYTFKFWLQYYGYAVLADVSESDMKSPQVKRPAGVYAFSAQDAATGGVRDQNGQFTQLVFASPALGISETRDISDRCAVIRNDPMWMGLRQMVDMYSNLLAESTITMRVNGINARSPYLLAASTDNVAKSAKSVMDKIEAGERGIIADAPITDDGAIKALNFGAGTKFTDLIEYHQYLKASRWNDIGINANFNMKREALNSAESALNTQSLLPLVDTMYATIKADLDKANEILGTNIGIEYDSSWKLVQSEVNNAETVSSSPQAEESPAVAGEQAAESAG